MQATATTEHYTLSLHDALPIFTVIDSERHYEILRSDGNAGIGSPFSGDSKIRITTRAELIARSVGDSSIPPISVESVSRDRKSTRLNSSHRCISYAVFCLKKKR